MDKQKNSTAVETIARTCIAVRLRSLNRVITGLYDDALRPLAIRVGQLNILVVAAKLGLARPAQVCEILQLDTSTLSRNVERMRVQGWLETVPAEDARAQPFRVTAAGRRLVDRAFPAWGRAQEKAAQLLGEDGVALLARTTGKLGMPQGSS